MPYQDYLQQRFNCPEPRVEAGLLLVDIASAAVDISDGLAADLGHITEESHSGAVLHLDKLPASPAVNALLNDKMKWNCQLGGGDDYELCFTIAPKNIPLMKERFKESGVDYTWVGEIIEGDSIIYKHAGGEVSLDISPYDHFSHGRLNQ